MPKNLAHTLYFVKGKLLGDRRLGSCSLGWILFHQLGHNGRELRANAPPVGDALVLQIN